MGARAFPQRRSAATRYARCAQAAGAARSRHGAALAKWRRPHTAPAGRQRVPVPRPEEALRRAGTALGPRLPPEVSGAGRAVVGRLLSRGGADAARCCRSAALEGCGGGPGGSAGPAMALPPPQKEIVYNKLLPYGERLEAEAARFLAQIKGNLARAVQLQELWPGGLFWTRKLST